MKSVRGKRRFGHKIRIVPPDYYQVLKIPRDADFKRIKNAFRMQISRWHPDRNPDRGAPERTRLILEAWEILKDPQKRRSYDLSRMPAGTSDEGARAQEWIRRAQDNARTQAERPLAEILKQAGIKTARWFVGCSLGLAGSLVVLGGTLWMTKRFGGSGLVYWVTFFVLWIGIAVLWQVFRRLLFFFRCDGCHAWVEFYYDCPACCRNGCFACTSMPLLVNFVQVRTESLCKYCGAVLKRRERNQKVKEWIR